MSMLANVKKGKVVRPVLALIYGPGGIGKSTWSSKTPHPIFLGAEEGTDHLDVARLPTPKNFEDVNTALKELAELPHDYKTLVVDSLDWIEPLIHDTICRREQKKSIELACGGYGKGYIEAYGEWLKFKDKLTELRDKRGMNVILLAHPEVVSTTNPQTQVTFQRYELKLHKRPKQMFMEYVDACFFTSYAMFVKRDGETVRAFSSGNRVMHVSWQEGFDAKNRYGLSESIPLTASWEEFVKLCGVEPKPDLPTLEEVNFKLSALLIEVKDEELLTKVKEAIAAAGNDVAQLHKIAQRLIALTSK